MGVSGLHPDELPRRPVRVPKERLAEFDRLMAAGGVQAVIEEVARGRDERRD